MGYYYDYFLGYEHEGKIYPLGVYDNAGCLHSVLSQSRSYACRLYEYMSPVKDSQISDELRKEFEHEDWFRGGEKIVDVKYLELSKLPPEQFLKKGYFLVEDVMRYEENDEPDVCFDGFYDSMTPLVYAEMLKREQMFGKPRPKKDCEGNEYLPKSAEDYMYYVYPDYGSIGYAVWLLNIVAGMYLYNRNTPDGAKLVVLETEG